MLTDAGIRLGVVVSDVHGQSARAMVKALLKGLPISQVLQLASRRLKASREEIFDALQGELTEDRERGKHRPILNDVLGEGFYDFLYDALTLINTHTRGAIYIAMSSSELDTLQAAFRAAGGHWSTFIIWAKNTFTLGRSDYQRQYEPILYGWPEGATHCWCGDRDQGDVWQIKTGNDLHPTMKPVELVERAIRNSSCPGDVVLDPFDGSGTTLIAAEKSGYLARLIELDPKYVDVIVRRSERFTGCFAIAADDGRRFGSVN